MAHSMHDVVVVGGGISGLTAAYNIRKRYPNVSILVLEANDRVGGRTHTVPLVAASGSDKWDVGGQWVGKCQTHVMKLLDEFGMETFRQYTDGSTRMQIGGAKVKSFKGVIPSLNVFALLDLQFTIWKTNYYQRQLDVSDPFDHPKASEWDAISVASFYDRTLFTKGARETVELALRVIFGAEANQLSFLFYLLYIRQAGDLEKLIEDKEWTAQEARIKLGAQQISHELTSRIGPDSVKLNEAVTSITQNPDGVSIVTSSGLTRMASRIVLAMPPKAIERITFSPNLPQDRVDFMRRMPLGNYTKIIVTYEKAFWRSKSLSGMAISSSPVNESGLPAPLTTVYDATSYNGNPALLGFMCAQPAVEWAMKPAKERQNAVLAHLASLFGQEAFSFLDYMEKDWNREPFTHGAPVSHLSVGGMKNYAQSIRRVEGRLHFAGTETATAWSGFMSGAIQAGERAALEVLQAIQPAALSSQDVQVLKEVDCARQRLSRKKTPHGQYRFVPTFVSLSVSIAIISCTVYVVYNYVNNEIGNLILQ